MRLFLRTRVPDIKRILLVESGARAITQALLPRLAATFGEQVPVDLVTCYPGLQEDGVFRVSEYSGRMGRRALYRKLRSRNYSVLGIVCSGEPIMWKWKWALALQLPVKVFIVNENGDFFWLDRSNRTTIVHFALIRSGLAGTGVARIAAQFAAFPFIFAYLLLYAAFVHSRRAFVRSS